MIPTNGSFCFCCKIRSKAAAIPVFAIGSCTNFPTGKGITTDAWATIPLKWLKRSKHWERKGKTFSQDSTVLKGIVAHFCTFSRLSCKSNERTGNLLTNRKHFSRARNEKNPKNCTFTNMFVHYLQATKITRVNQRSRRYFLPEELEFDQIPVHVSQSKDHRTTCASWRSGRKTSTHQYFDELHSLFLTNFRHCKPAHQLFSFVRNMFSTRKILTLNLTSPSRLSATSLGRYVNDDGNDNQDGGQDWYQDAQFPSGFFLQKRWIGKVKRPAFSSNKSTVLSSSFRIVAAVSTFCRKNKQTVPETKCCSRTSKTRTKENGTNLTNNEELIVSQCEA